MGYKINLVLVGYDEHFNKLNVKVGNTSLSHPVFYEAFVVVSLCVYMCLLGQI